MYKVKLHPDKCSKRDCWLVRNYQEGDIVAIADNHFNYHKDCKGCMDILEHYRVVTVKREKCKYCGNIVIRRKKIIYTL